MLRSGRFSSLEQTQQPPVQGPRNWKCKAYALCDDGAPLKADWPELCFWGHSRSVPRACVGKHSLTISVTPWSPGQCVLTHPFFSAHLVSDSIPRWLCDLGSDSEPGYTTLWMYCHLEVTSEMRQCPQLATLRHRTDEYDRQDPG